jgi:hypothetical protein
MITWSGVDVHDLEKEVSWLTAAGISTIMNRRIIIHAGLYAVNPVECVRKLRECEGVICSVAAADILMGNWYPISSMLLLFPTGRLASFAKYMMQEEGYQCCVEACDDTTTVLVRDSPRFTLSLRESETEDAVLPAEQFTSTCDCIFVGPTWYGFAYPEVFVLRAAFQMESDTLDPPSDEVKAQWKMRGFKLFDIDGYYCQRRRGGDQKVSRTFDTAANIRFPIDGLPLPTIM